MKAYYRIKFKLENEFVASFLKSPRRVKQNWTLVRLFRGRRFEMNQRVSSLSRKSPQSLRYPRSLTQVIFNNYNFVPFHLGFDNVHFVSFRLGLVCSECFWAPVTNAFDAILLSRANHVKYIMTQHLRDIAP